jgi:hypothetical protein
VEYRRNYGIMLVMAKGKTKSEYSLGERRERAYELFMRGRTVIDVSRMLGVHYETASRYRQEYEQRIREVAQANPGMLREVLDNTVRALAELDQVRRAAWDEYEDASHPTVMVCPNCEAEIEIPAANRLVRNSLLNTLVKVQEQRSKLFGLFGVKAEFLSLVNSVRHVQTKLLEFMRRELCAADRQKLETLLLGELRPYMEADESFPALPSA